MGLLNPQFRDINVRTVNLRVHIPLSVFGGRFRKAQIWLDKQVITRMTPYVPRKTGDFLRRIQNSNVSRYGTGKLIVGLPPQGKRLYPGVAKNGKPYKWSNSDTKPYWGEYTVRTNKKALCKGVENILAGRKI